nr:PREDICTED: alpha-endosulfine isoform X1 [Struthio camelus australis]
MEREGLCVFTHVPEGKAVFGGKVFMISSKHGWIFQGTTPHLASKAPGFGLAAKYHVTGSQVCFVFPVRLKGFQAPLVFQDTQEKETVIPERAEEAKLKAKYPNLGQKPGGSDFLMKRLQKGQKYFDSGDYNMAKAKMKNKQLPSAGPDKNLVTGDHIPTPQDLPQRKSSLVTSKLAG